jgi:NitT/TauT family transport system ATP-binding protein
MIVGPLTKLVTPDPRGAGGPPSAGTTEPTSFLALRGIRKDYADGNGQVTRVLAPIDLDIHAGEFLAIVGPSGTGKTTLLKIIAGLIAPSAGQVVLQGRRISGPPPEMVYLSQQYGKSLLPWRTVLKNVEFPLEHRAEIGRAERRERAREALAGVGLGAVEDRYPWQLSGGMQQRVTIARALAARPSVLLLDEAFSSVDALTRMELQDLILNTWREHALTMVLVTHDIDEAIYLADRVAVMSHPPATIVELLSTNLARPREQIATRADARFLELRIRLYERVRRQHGEALR